MRPGEPAVIWRHGGVFTSHTIVIRDRAQQYQHAHDLSWGEPREIARLPDPGFIAEVRYDSPAGEPPRALIVKFYGPADVPDARAAGADKIDWGAR